MAGLAARRTRIGFHAVLGLVNRQDGLGFALVVAGSADLVARQGSVGLLRQRGTGSEQGCERGCC